jgi:hypothetical protein
MTMGIHQQMSDKLPQADAHVNFTYEYLDTGVMVHIDWVGGDIVEIPLESLSGNNLFIRRSGDYIIIGQYTVRILGYKSPGSLVCKLVGIGKEDFE